MRSSCVDGAFSDTEEQRAALSGVDLAADRHRVRRGRLRGLDALLVAAASTTAAGGLAALGAAGSRLARGRQQRRHPRHDGPALQRW